MFTTPEQTAIESLLYAYGDALNAASVPQVLALYTPDGVFMPTGAPSASGLAQVQQAYEGIFQQIRLHIKLHMLEIVVSGDYAFASTTSAGTTFIHTTGQTVAEENRELFVLQRHEGQWKIARYMFNKMA
ncbi:MAG: YybH family protein [Janthinobacterium lividum]